MPVGRGGVGEVTQNAVGTKNPFLCFPTRCDWDYLSRFSHAYHYSVTPVQNPLHVSKQITQSACGSLHTTPLFSSFSPCLFFFFFLSLSLCLSLFFPPFFFLSYSSETRFDPVFPFHRSKSNRAVVVIISARNNRLLKRNQIYFAQLITSHLTT